MRIIAGEFRSRKLKTLEGDATRPTSDRVKEAIFSSIGPYFKGGSVLDLFAGSGAIGLEALSRGMEQAYFADANNDAIHVIYDNIRSLDVEKRCTVWKMDFIQVLKRCMALDLQFDLIYLDPPYKKQQNDLVLETIDVFNLLKEKGTIIVESTIEDSFKENYGKIKKNREVEYGKIKVSYYGKE